MEPLIFIAICVAWVLRDLHNGSDVHHWKK